MEGIITDELLNILMVSITFSVILMAFIQKFKDLQFINKSWQTWFLNLIFAFAVGIPFAMNFYGLKLIPAIWVGLFGFIGAPTLYEALKDQKIINYTPKSTSDNISNIEISTNNEIKRD